MLDDDLDWTEPLASLERRLGSGPTGLSDGEAARRRAATPGEQLTDHRWLTWARLLLAQVDSPLVVLLLIAAVVSVVTGDLVDAAIVLAIVGGGVALGFSREYRAEVTLAELRARTRTRARVIRGGRAVEIAAPEVVPGDRLLLSAGTLIPADARLLQATSLFVDQAVLTGESFPVEKSVAPAPAGAALAARGDCVFRGSNVRSGTGLALVVRTGSRTAFGAIAARLVLRPPETEFDRGIRRFGYLLLATMSVVALVVFVANTLLGRPPVETLLFTLALAVGLSPELLPAILNANLAHGAQLMADHGVLVRRLSAIENLGSIDVLCVDKTGTLTEGVVSLEGAYDPEGRPSPAVLELAALNAHLQSGLENPLDGAITRAASADLSATKLGEIPYDFVRKRLSVVVERAGRPVLVAKGAFDPLLAACTTRAGGGALDAEVRADLRQRFADWSDRGMRVLGVATRSVERREAYPRDAEAELCFEGFLVFADRPKDGAREALADLARDRVTVKVITGDSRRVAEHVAGAVGMVAPRVLTGQDLDELRDETLWHAAERTDLFVEVDPNQKERIILALKKTGHVVAFMGDGVNDAPAMHASDTSISVEGATDVAKAAADFVLLERRLDVVHRGIVEGRRTFANTLKYVLTTTSANLGNMVSMAVASVFLPFLPLTAGQILLNNLLSDVPALGLARDRVDPELVDRPRRWSMRFIGRFMIGFGLLSSLFDLLTFAALLWLVPGDVAGFRTGWFVESLLTELVIALVVRTRRPLLRSRPGRPLLALTGMVAVLTVALPYLPGVSWLGFTPLPPQVLAVVVLITAAYVLAAEQAKQVVLGDGERVGRRTLPDPSIQAS